MIGRTSRILQTKPDQWINVTNSNSISANIAFQNLGSITATGTAGATSLTASSSVASLMFSSQQFRVGSDIYTVSSISGATINIVGTLSTNYSAVQIQVYKDSAIWDSSGNSRNATQATAGNQPIPYSSINGRSALFFNGVDTVLLTPNTTALDPESGGFTIFFVYRSRNNTTGRHLVAKGALNTSTQGWAIIPYPGTNAYVSIVTRPSPPAFNDYLIPFTDDLTAAILCLTFDGSTATLYKNGVSVGSVAYVGSVTYSAGSGSIGARNNTTNFAAFDFGELIQWKRLLSDTERNMITTELGKKWGIAV